MNTALESMLAKYSANSPEEKKNAIKEIVQEIVLCGLSRAGFFEAAAFYGGTALRIFYGLDRFSEDLDFSLTKPDASFTLDRYFPVLEKELLAYGLGLAVSIKEKTKDSAIQSAFVKGNTRQLVLSLFADGAFARSITGTEAIKVKFEVDTNPPGFASFEHKYQLLPSPYEVMMYDMPSLFAGKIHAVLCRSWKNRVKGRDLYDYVFYLSKSTPVNLDHLRARLIDSGAISSDAPFDKAILKNMLSERFGTIDYRSAKDDVSAFIRDKSSLTVWSADFFRQITEQL